MKNFKKSWAVLTTATVTAAALTAIPQAGAQSANVGLELGSVEVNADITVGSTGDSLDLGSSDNAGGSIDQLRGLLSSDNDAEEPEPTDPAPEEGSNGSLDLDADDVAGSIDMARDLLSSEDEEECVDNPSTAEDECAGDDPEGSLDLDEEDVAGSIDMARQLLSSEDEEPGEDEGSSAERPDLSSGDGLDLSSDDDSDGSLPGFLTPILLGSAALGLGSVMTSLFSSLLPTSSEVPGSEDAEDSEGSGDTEGSEGSGETEGSLEGFDGSGDTSSPSSIALSVARTSSGSGDTSSPSSLATSGPEGSVSIVGSLPLLSAPALSVAPVLSAPLLSSAPGSLIGALGSSGSLGSASPLLLLGLGSLGAAALSGTGSAAPEGSSQAPAPEAGEAPADDATAPEDTMVDEKAEAVNGEQGAAPEDTMVDEKAAAVNGEQAAPAAAPAEASPAAAEEERGAQLAATGTNSAVLVMMAIGLIVAAFGALMIGTRARRNN